MNQTAGQSLILCLFIADRFTVYSAKKLRQAWNK